MRSPSAILRAIGPDGREHDVRIDGTLLTIGRAADNGLVLDDAAVSRHHARLAARHGVLVLTDLGSHERRPGQRGPGRRGGARGGRPDRDRRHGPRRRGASPADALMDPAAPRRSGCIRLLFLGLLYVFLLGSSRALLRDLRAAAREPAAELGRLIVVGSPSGEPAPGRRLRARRDHDARPRRQQRDRGRRPVRLAPSTRSLTFRGRAWYVEDLEQHQRHVRQRQPGRRARRRSPSATRSRSGRSGCGSSGPRR